METREHAIRGRYIRFNSSPFESNSSALDYQSDGMVVIQGDTISRIGPAHDILPTVASNMSINHLPKTHILCAGFIDTHVHYPQLEIIGSAGHSLLDWLNKFVFPTEADVKDTRACEVAERFVRACLQHGTTTFATFCTVHSSSVDAIFKAASHINMRCIAGKVLMDQNSPTQLCDSVHSGIAESAELIERWHLKGRNHYAITPRFVPSCSDAQLVAAAELWNAYQTTYLQSHVAENKQEVEWVKQLHPQARSYLDVYDRFGLLGPRALYAHGIWLDAKDRQRLIESETKLIHCPSSNLFLGSGVLNLTHHLQHGASALTGLGTDIGAGTSLCLLRTLGDAYHIGRFNEYGLSGTQGFYWITLGNATALNLQHKIGNLDVGKEADMVVIDTEATPLLAQRMQRCDSIEDVLSTLMILGDDRCIAKTYIAGALLFTRAHHALA